MHQQLESLSHTLQKLRTVLRIFESKGIPRLITFTPETDPKTDLTRYVHIIQCQQSNWNIQVWLVHGKKLLDPSIYVLFDYPHQKAGFCLIHHHEATEKDRSAYFKREQDQDRFNRACELIHMRRSRINPEQLFTGFSYEQFLLIIEDLAKHTKERHRVTTSRLRSPAPSARHKKRRLPPREETGSLFDTVT